MQARRQIDRSEEMLPRESFGQLLTQLATHSAALVRDEMALAKQEMRESLRSLRTGIATLAIGALIGWIALLTLAAAAVIGLANFMHPGYAALIVGVGLAIVGGTIVLVGINRLKQTNLVPEQTMESLEEDKQWLKELT
jgi:putative superfamily III holin-X